MASQPAVSPWFRQHFGILSQRSSNILGMFMCALFLAASLVVGAAHAAKPHNAHEAHTTHVAPEPVVTELMTRPLSNIAGKEVMILTVDYPPGGADPVHRHDAHGFVYVLEGSVVMGVKGGPELTLQAGQTFHEGPEDIHTVGRNASQTKPAKFVVFLLKDEGVPPVLPPN